MVLHLWLIRLHVRMDQWDGMEPCFMKLEMQHFLDGVTPVAYSIACENGPVGRYGALLRETEGSQPSLPYALHLHRHPCLHACLYARPLNRCVPKQMPSFLRLGTWLQH